MFCSPELRKFGLFNITVCRECCSVALSPITDGLQQGEKTDVVGDLHRQQCSHSACATF